MLIDSNIIIYAAKPEYAELRGLIADHSFPVKLLHNKSLSPSPLKNAKR
jgi:hypothetical protein